MEMKEIMKELGSRISNIGTLVDTNPDNDETTSYLGKKSGEEGPFAGGGIRSDKKLKDIDTTNTADVIEKAYKGLDDIIYKYNHKGQALGEDDKLRAGVTAQSMEGSILESAVMEDPATGYKMVDTRHLALANAAAIKEIFERLDKLETRAILAKE